MTVDYRLLPSRSFVLGTLIARRTTTDGDIKACHSACIVHESGAFLSATHAKHEQGSFIWLIFVVTLWQLISCLQGCISIQGECTHNLIVAVAHQFWTAA